MAPLIFVYDGILPDYCFYSLELSKKYSSKKIILLVSKNNTKLPNDIEYHYIEDFYNFDLSDNIKFDEYRKNFWNGFWVKTIERFFILESFCKKKNIISFFHAELDNIVFNIVSLDKKLDKFGKKLFFTKDRLDRGMVGFIYINSINYLSDFCNFCLENLKKNYFIDFELLGKFSNIYNEKCAILPNELHAFQNDKISFKAIDVSNIDGIIDGVRIGAFLFGDDPRISKGFVYNRVQPSGNDNITNFNYNDLLFYFLESKKELIIKDKKTNKKVKIYNLHIHSKLFKKISIEKNFLSILNKINMNQRSLMSLNLDNIYQNVLGSFNSRIFKTKN